MGETMRCVLHRLCSAGRRRAFLRSLIYLPSGGFLALRRRRSIWLHVAVVLWGVGSVVLHFCAR